MRDLSGRMRHGIDGYFTRFDERAGFERCPGEDAGECGLVGLALAAVVAVSVLVTAGGLRLI